MKFSIIVPVYKVENYLSQCVDSILAQTYKNFELILVDDGSPDSCPFICDTYGDKDCRVKVIHKENGGLSSARNIALPEAKGEYIVYLDSDDFFATNESLEKIAQKTITSPDIIMYKTAACDYKGDNIIYPPMALNYSSDNCDVVNMLSHTIAGEEFQTSAWSKAIRREFLIEHGCKFKEKLLGEDIDWYLDVIRHVKTYETVDEYLYVYRNRPGSITKAFGIKNLTDLIWILEKWTKILGDSPVDNALMGYLGKTYTSLLIVYSSVIDQQKTQYKERIKKLSYLLGYDAYSRTRIIKKFYQLVGFNGVILLLSIAKRIKK